MLCVTGLTSGLYRKKYFVTIDSDEIVLVCIGFPSDKHSSGWASEYLRSMSNGPEKAHIGHRYACRITMLAYRRRRRLGSFGLSQSGSSRQNMPFLSWVPIVAPPRIKVRVTNQQGLIVVFQNTDFSPWWRT